MNDKYFEKRNIKIVISIQLCIPVPKQITSDFGTKFAQKTLSGGVLGQMQPENN